MPTNPGRLLDPELVVPSAASVLRLEFWDRMNTWATDREPRVGPSTMLALNELAANQPSIPGLPSGDFWSILGKYMSRGFVSNELHRPLCEKHLGAQYLPHMGAADNFQRLVDDIRAVGPTGALAVSTVEQCWTDVNLDDCSICAIAPVMPIFNPISPGECSGELAAVWRRGYRAEHPADPSLLERFAHEMFPAIEFSAAAWGQLNTMVGAPEETVDSVISHLAVLNDSAVDIWDSEITPQGRQAALGGRVVSASLEGPRTHKNIQAMKTRDFQFRDREVRCEWHCKLRPEINRIYFAVQEKKVFVGTIVDHLPT
jgi:hypothetical protein